MPNQVPEEVKQQRLDRLMTEQQAISLERNRLRVGNEERVLVESVGADGLPWHAPRWRRRRPTASSA